MSERKRLTDILYGNADTIRRQWNETEAAEDFAPLPGGEFIARIISGELTESRNGTPGYKLTFQVLEGEHEGRRFWNDVWLTAPALPMAKRDLGKLGISSLEQLEQPLPAGIRCKCKLALRRDDDGNEYNRLRSFQVLGIDEPERDAFAPDDETEAAGGEPSKAGGNGDGIDDTDIEFDPAKLDAELAAEQARQ